MNAVERQAQAVKVWLTAAACLLWFVACGWATKTFFFDSTAPFTSKNTYQITASSAEIRFETRYVSRVKGSDCEQLRMYIGDERYTVTWWEGGREGPQKGDLEAVLPLLEEETSLTLTVFEDALFFNGHYVVDVRSPSTVYFDISIEGAEQKTDRSLIWFLLWMPVFFFLLGVFFLCDKLLPPPYRKTFDRINNAINKAMANSRKKTRKPPVIPPKKPKEKRERSADSLFRDEE